MIDAWNELQPDDLDLDVYLERTVEIHTVRTDDSGKARTYCLSGYVVGDGLVLTCEHDVLGADTIKVRPVTGDRWFTATIEWHSGDEGPETDRIDAVLLRAEGLGVPGRPSWGEFDGFVRAGAAFCIGMPAASRVDRERHDHEPFAGRFVPGAAISHGRMRFTIAGKLPKDDSMLGGLSGAMLLDRNGLLLGIACERDDRWPGRFTVLPAALLRQRRKLWAALGDPAIDQITTYSKHRWIKPAYEQPGEETDFKLITARYRQVDFVEGEGGDDALARLLAWCIEPAAEGAGKASVRVMVGPGGTGKTRLAAELCDRLHEQHGWKAGFAREDEGLSWSEFDPAAEAGPVHPTLVVFDYVERPAMVSKVIDLLTNIEERADSLRAPVRVLLVSRSTDNWYEQIDDYGRGVLSRQLGVDRGDQLIELDKRPFGKDERRRHFETAYRRFRLAGSEPVGTFLGRVNDAAYKTPLMVHMAALIAAREGELAVAGRSGGLRNGLLDDLIRRERRNRWKHKDALVTDQRVGPESSDQAKHAVVVMTMTGAEAYDGTDLLLASPLWGDQDANQRRNAVNAVIELYPGITASDDDVFKRAAPIEPDLISEHLVMSIREIEVVLDRLLERDMRTEHYVRLIHLLGLTANHYPAGNRLLHKAVQETFARLKRRGDSVAAICDLLGQNLTTLIEVAVEQARAGVPDMAATLADLLERMEGDRQTSEVVSRSDPAACKGHPELVRLRGIMYRHAAAHHEATGDGEKRVISLEGVAEVAIERDDREIALETIRRTVRLRSETAQHRRDVEKLTVLLDRFITDRDHERVVALLGEGAELLRRMNVSPSVLAAWQFQAIRPGLAEPALQHELLAAFETVTLAMLAPEADADPGTEAYDSHLVLLESMVEAFSSNGSHATAFAFEWQAIRIRHELLRDKGFDESVYLSRLQLLEDAIDRDIDVEGASSAGAVGVEARRWLAGKRPEYRERFAETLAVAAADHWAHGRLADAVRCFQEQTELLSEIADEGIGDTDRLIEALELLSTAMARTNARRASRPYLQRENELRRAGEWFGDQGRIDMAASYEREAIVVRTTWSLSGIDLIKEAESLRLEVVKQLEPTRPNLARKDREFAQDWNRSLVKELREAIRQYEAVRAIAAWPHGRVCLTATLMRLSSAMAAAGDNEGAISAASEAAEEAAGLLRRSSATGLWRRPPPRASNAYLPLHADAHLNLAIRLADGGQLPQAVLEAMDALGSLELLVEHNNRFSSLRDEAEEFLRGIRSRI